MTFEYIEYRLAKCLSKLIKRDYFLLINNLNERSISHRLALYLSFAFKNFDVDCEYNGNVDASNGRKYIYILKERADELNLKTTRCDSEITARDIYPDIIVHRRGLNGSDNNLLVIEIKKSSSQVSGDWDAEKLRRFTSPEYGNSFEYLFGAFIEFQVGNEIGFTVEWYQNGKKMIRDELDNNK